VVDGEALRQFFSVETLLGIQTAAVILFVIRMWSGAPAMLAQWIAYRRAKAEEKAADWERIRHERDVATEAAKVGREEIDMLRDKLAEVEAGRIEWMGEAVRYKAIVQGYGEARQLQAVEDAMKRYEESKPEGNGGAARADDGDGK
jgi:hypothetical protein